MNYNVLINLKKLKIVNNIQIDDVKTLDFFSKHMCLEKVGILILGTPCNMIRYSYSDILIEKFPEIKLFRIIFQKKNFLIEIQKSSVLNLLNIKQKNKSTLFTLIEFNQIIDNYLEERKKDVGYAKKKNRKQYTLQEKRVIVQEIIRRENVIDKKKCNEVKKKREKRKIIPKIKDEKGIKDISVIRKWRKNLLFSSEENKIKKSDLKKKKIGVGRKHKYGVEIVDSVINFCDERELEKKSTTNDDIAMHLSLNFENINEEIKPYEISRIKKRGGLSTQKKTNKNALDIDLQLLLSWDLWVISIVNEPMVLIVNIDETPMPELIIGKTTIVRTRRKRVDFIDGGKQKNHTMVPGTFVVLHIGKIVFAGKCGMGEF